MLWYSSQRLSLISFVIVRPHSSALNPMWSTTWYWSIYCLLIGLEAYPTLLKVIIPHHLHWPLSDEIVSTVGARRLLHADCGRGIHILKPCNNKRSIFGFNKPRPEIIVSCLLGIRGRVAHKMVWHTYRSRLREMLRSCFGSLGFGVMNLAVLVRSPCIWTWQG